MSTGKPTPKKPSLNPEAAKVLERYRNATQGIPSGEASGVDGTGVVAPNKPSGAPAASPMRRSGTRGK